MDKINVSEISIQSQNISFDHINTKIYNTQRPCYTPVHLTDQVDTIYPITYVLSFVVHLIMTIVLLNHSQFSHRPDNDCWTRPYLLYYTSHHSHKINNDYEVFVILAIENLVKLKNTKWLNIYDQGLVAHCVDVA